MEEKYMFIPVPMEKFWRIFDAKIDQKLSSLELLAPEHREELLDVHQVAELLHTTPQNVHAKKRAGQLPFVRFGGRILFKRSEVIESLKSVKIQKQKS